ncbi:ABC transporter permease subunit [uncultured Pseudokineococcus sp.]|uniref:ABC transporter permease subunit n=1 Tax=uncultured Pseudokineococcus sp. TaxID=1642928 RepID=UPI002604203E|nr:ABC transporter permease subunit [uncultured Pseudokineococcus sp.]
MVRELARWDVRQRWRSAAGTGAALGVVGVMVVALYPSVGRSLGDLADQLPAAVANLLGGASTSTLAGWVEFEYVSILGPFALLLLGGVLGAGWLAGAEEERTTALVLATPATRRGVVLAALVAGVPLLVLAAALSAVGLLVGDALVAEGDLSLGGVVAVHLQLVGLGVLGLALALAVGALGGRRALALGLVGAVGVVSFLVDGFAPTVDGLAWAERLSAFSWAVGSSPLTGGLDGAGLAVLLGAAAALVVVAVVAHERRDLHA